MTNSTMRLIDVVCSNIAASRHIEPTSDLGIVRAELETALGQAIAMNPRVRKAFKAAFGSQMAMIGMAGGDLPSVRPSESPRPARIAEDVEAIRGASVAHAKHPWGGYTIHVDGSVGPGNPGPSGIGVVLSYEGAGHHIEIEARPVYSVPIGTSTNQRGEVLAAVFALDMLEDGCEVKLVSDSQYLVKTMTGEFRRKSNLDVWAELDRAISRHRKVTSSWVKGHATDVLNGIADKAAGKASKIARDMTFTSGPPAETGSAESPASATMSMG